MGKLLDGKKTSQDIKNEIKEEIIKLKEETGKIPGIAVILVGEDGPSQIYVNAKERTCKEIGIHSEKLLLDENTTEEHLLNVIKNYNNNEMINGILIQLPLPAHISPKKVLEAISPEKDVDGFHPLNNGKMMVNSSKFFYPCTPYGVIELLKRNNIEIEGKEAVVVGRSNIVGKPLAVMLIREGATTTCAHRKTVDLKRITLRADILITAVGKANLITADMVKENVIIVDVGMNRVNGKLRGDTDFENILEKASYITPVPGGVGPMTIAMLMKNTLESFKRYHGKD